MSGAAVFILVTPAKKECCQRKKESVREREIERDMQGGKTGERGGKEKTRENRRDRES